MRRKKIFLSSTFTDLKDERQAVTDAIRGLTDYEVIGMEGFGAQSCPALDTCLKEVQKADIYIGLLSDKYGSIHEESGKSYTELEYDHFSGGTKLIFLKNDVNYNDTETGLQYFVERLKQKHTPDFWANGSDLVFRVLRALKQNAAERSVETGLMPDKYTIHVKGANTYETRVVEYLNTENVTFGPNPGDNILKWCTFVSHTRPFTQTYDFTSGELPSGFVYQSHDGSFKKSSRTGAWEKVMPNQPCFIKLDDGAYGLRLEPSRTNYAHQFNQTTSKQAIHLPKGEYTFWIEGKGKVELVGDIKALIDEKTDLEFCVVESCNILVKRYGSIRHVQLEDGMGKTAKIPTPDAQVTRGQELLQFNQDT